MDLVDKRCKASLAKIGLATVAEKIAAACVETGAAEGEVTLRFLKDDDEASADFVAELSVKVKRV